MAQPATDRHDLTEEPDALTRTSGTVRGVPRKWHPYRDLATPRTILFLPKRVALGSLPAAPNLNKQRFVLSQIVDTNTSLANLPQTHFRQ